VTRIVVVTSGKGGVGKTTTSASFSTGLAMRGFKTAVIDFDVGLRNLDLIMGCERRVVYDLINVINGEATLTQALIKDKHTDNLYVLPASQTRDKDALSEEGVEKVIKELEHQGFDYIVCDSPAGIESGAVMALTFADEALVVTNPEVSSVRDSDRILGILQAKSRRGIEGRDPVKEQSKNTCSSPATTRPASRLAKCCRTRTFRKFCECLSSASFQSLRKCCKPPTRVHRSFTKKIPMPPMLTKT
jgi:septum site-determining protein MinD